MSTGQAAEHYRDVLRSLDQGFCIVELLFDSAMEPVDCVFLEMNPSFERQTGLQDAVGRRMSELVPVQDEQWLVICAQVALTGEPRRFEHEAVAHERWYDVHVFRVGDVALRRVAVLFDDITERKRTESVLRQSRQRQAFLLMLSDTLRPRSDPVDITGEAARLLGEHLDVDRCYYFEADVERGHYVIHRDYARSVASIAGTFAFGDWAVMGRAVASGQPLIIPDVATTPLTSDHERAALEAMQIRSLIMFTLIKDRRFVAALVAAQSEPRVWTAREIDLVGDVAERTWAAVGRARAETALRASEEQLREADRHKDEFLAMLAHELRNPLAPVATGLELIRVAGNTPEAVDRVRSMMERQLGHMVRLVDDLLDVSRITSGSIRLRREPTPLSALINSAIEARRSALVDKGIELEVDLPESLCLLDVDPTRFVQVLSNLLDNATKFTEPGGSVRLSARVEPEPSAGPGEVTLSVRDTGMGIEPDLQPRVFDLFMRGERASAQPGLGIGLALAHRLVEMHGGEIAVRSEGAGQGSEFVVRLPCSTQIGSTPQHEVARPQVTCRAVVIDDNRDAADALGMLVEALGGESRTAYDGKSGLREVLRDPPDIVLLDLAIPGLDGYETCRRIRRELGDEVMVVAVTGFGQDRDKNMAAAAGFDAHLTKPPDPGALAVLLQRASGEGDSMA